MRILIIHNSADKVRSDNILKQFAGQNAKYTHETVEAIMNPAQPAVGIKRSFCKAIQRAKDNGWKQVLILEDDFCCLHPDSLEIFIKKSKETYFEDSLFLAGIYEGELKAMDWNFPGNSNYPVSKVIGKLSGLHAMIVHKQLYDKLLSAEEPYHLDYWISMEAKIPTYVCHPFLIIQNDGYSSNTKSITQYNKTLHLKYKLINPI